MASDLTGGCQCEAVRYSVKSPLGAAYACHCGECKKQSASAFSMSIPMHFSELSVSGIPTCFETVAFSGNPKYNYFCAQCGTRLWHSGTNPAEQITLKVGTLDHAADIEPLGHLWVSKKQRGITLDPASDQYDTQPENILEWRMKLGRNT